jgi:hypothetical protein
VGLLTGEALLRSLGPRKGPLESACERGALGWLSAGYCTVVWLGLRGWKEPGGLVPSGLRCSRDRLG